MLAQKLRKGAQKIHKANKGKWRTLSTGEKILKVILTLIKLALIVWMGAVVFVLILAAWAAFAIMSGITGAVDQEVQRTYYNRRRNTHYW